MNSAGPYFEARFRDPAFWARQAEIADRNGMAEEAAKCRALEEKARAAVRG